MKTLQGPDTNGVYEARVEIRTPDGRWLQKPANGGVNAMFPKDWDAERVHAEINSAWHRKLPGQEPNRWRGLSASGVEIEGYIRPRITAYPVRKRDPQ